MATGRKTSGKTGGKGKRGADATPDAIELLEADHEKVQSLFKEFEKADRDDPEACRAIVETAIAELKIHTTIEEEIFYPAAREALAEAEEEEGEDLLNEAEIEHDSAKVLIERLEGLQPDDPYYAATFTVLGEYVKHHIKEEEGELFEMLRKEKAELADLGEAMRVRKEELKAEMGMEAPGAANEEAAGEDQDPAEEERAAARRSRAGER
jgi:hemerythrin-like domain-containing protein